MDCKIVRGGDTCVASEVYPKPGENTLKFKKYGNLFKHTIKIYADFECALEEMDENSGSIQKHMRHIPVCFAIRVVSHIKEFQPKDIVYSGGGAGKGFMFEISEIAKKAHEFLITDTPAKRTPKETEKFNMEKVCFACGGEFVEGDDNLEKCFDHNYITGEYRCAMHNYCNRVAKKECEIPKFLHNFGCYDVHLIVRELDSMDNGKVNCIMQNNEKCISISKDVFVDEVEELRVDEEGDVVVNREIKRFQRVVFKDSFRFINRSIDSIAKGLPEKSFEPLKKVYGEDWELRWSSPLCKRFF